MRHLEHNPHVCGFVSSAALDLIEGCALPPPDWRTSKTLLH